CRCRRSRPAASATPAPRPRKRKSRRTACSATASTIRVTPGAPMRNRLAAAAFVFALLGGCSGSGGSGGLSACLTGCAADFLSESDVQRIVAQAVGEAQARNARAHVVVVDRVGNVLATFRMDGAPESVT